MDIGYHHSIRILLIILFMNLTRCNTFGRTRRDVDLDGDSFCLDLTTEMHKLIFDPRHTDQPNSHLGRVLRQNRRNERSLGDLNKGVLSSIVEPLSEIQIQMEPLRIGSFDEGKMDQVMFLVTTHPNYGVLIKDSSTDGGGQYTNPTVVGNFSWKDVRQGTILYKNTISLNLPSWKDYFTFDMYVSGSRMIVGMTYKVEIFSKVRTAIDRAKSGLTSFINPFPISRSTRNPLFLPASQPTKTGLKIVSPKTSPTASITTKTVDSRTLPSPTVDRNKVINNSKKLQGASHKVSPTKSQIIFCRDGADVTACTSMATSYFISKFQFHQSVPTNGKGGGGDVVSYEYVRDRWDQFVTTVCRETCAPDHTDISRPIKRPNCTILVRQTCMAGGGHGLSGENLDMIENDNSLKVNQCITKNTNGLQGVKVKTKFYMACASLKGLKPIALESNLIKSPIPNSQLYGLCTSRKRKKVGSDVHQNPNDLSYGYIENNLTNFVIGQISKESGTGGNGVPFDPEADPGSNNVVTGSRKFREEKVKSSRILFVIILTFSLLSLGLLTLIVVFSIRWFVQAPKDPKSSPRFGGRFHKALIFNGNLYLGDRSRAVDIGPDPGCETLTTHPTDQNGLICNGMSNPLPQGVASHREVPEHRATKVPEIQRCNEAKIGIMDRDLGSRIINNRVSTHANQYEPCFKLRKESMGELEARLPGYRRLPLAPLKFHDYNGDDQTTNERGDTTGDEANHHRETGLKSPPPHTQNNTYKGMIPKTFEPPAGALKLCYNGHGRVQDRSVSETDEGHRGVDQTAENYNFQQQQQQQLNGQYNHMEWSENDSTVPSISLSNFTGDFIEGASYLPSCKLTSLEEYGKGNTNFSYAPYTTSTEYNHPVASSPIPPIEYPTPPNEWNRNAIMDSNPRKGIIQSATGTGGNGVRRTLETMPQTSPNVTINSGNGRDERESEEDPMSPGMSRLNRYLKCHHPITAAAAINNPSSVKLMMDLKSRLRQNGRAPPPIPEQGLAQPLVGKSNTGTGGVETNGKEYLNVGVENNSSSHTVRDQRSSLPTLPREHRITTHGKEQYWV